MKRFPLGNTGLQASKVAFGALPIQREKIEDTTALLRAAYEGGINFYDTARGYTDSEHKLGTALGDVRKDIIISSKVSGAKDGAQAAEMIEESLRQLRTDYIDIMQFHNALSVPRPGDADGLYDALVKAKQQGKIRFIGLTSHRLAVGKEAAESGLYDTIQFPISYLSSDEDTSLIDLCYEKNIGFLAMKGLAGGMLTNAAPVYHFFEGYEAQCRPLYGIQRMNQLQEFLSYAQKAPDVADMDAIIAKDKAELGGDFCRGCGYCEPCTVEIPLHLAVRMETFLNRMPVDDYMTQSWYDAMQRVNDCTDCGACEPRCPYGLNPRKYLKHNYDAYMRIYKEYHSR